MYPSDDLIETAIASDDLFGLADSLQGLLTVIVPVLIGVVVIIVLLSLLLVVSRLRSQRATVAMQQDIRAIREIIERRYANDRPAATKDDPQLPPQP